MSENTNTTKNTAVYEINPDVLNSVLGYSARIDGDSIMVVANLYGEGYNLFNEKINLIKHSGFVLVNGERTQSGKFENLSDNQLYQLVTAGVIVLNEKQQEEFRKKFFDLQPNQTKRK